MSHLFPYRYYLERLSLYMWQFAWRLDCAESNIGNNELMKVQLDYISEDNCKKGYAEDLGSRRLPQGLIPNLLCAGVMEGGKDTCQVCATRLHYI